MGHSQAEKAASRERVLRIAARKIRQDGMSGPGVAEIMREAGLTHGGFYKHFASRDDLIAQAATAALTEVSTTVEQLAEKSGQEQRAGIIDAYLAKEHRDNPATGCALVTLGSAAGRGDPALKEAYEKRVRGYLDRFGGKDSEEARAEALLTLSALVGATLLARAVADPSLSDELLDTVAKQLKQR
ncbi:MULTISPECIES: TetR/AcrR family transcriptional regulator [unclassified Streptomyces]|uniref:TetR/AcrR family transcriptional regulator n=1 Tax=unclassified Streptomyces TaxID=2593676 RepID=UPI0004C80E14|nr:TetR/AcrR family transcriptional regulator [Streptomyces sp. NRRL S-31]